MSADDYGWNENDQLNSPSPGSTKDTVVLITGGWSTKGFSSMEFYPGSSCSLPPLPEVRGGHISFVTSGTNPKVTLCGGNNAHSVTSSCVVFDVENQRWDENMIGRLTMRRARYAAVTVESVGTYIIGGDMSNNPRTTEFLEEGGREWVVGPNIPGVDMTQPCAVQISPLSYLVIFGFNILEYQVDVADLTSSSGWQTNKWPSLQTERNNLPGCALLGNKVVIAGGYSSSNYLKSTEILDLSTKTITYAGDMNSPRGHFHLATPTLGGTTKLFAIGGVGNGKSSHHSSVEEFHLSNNSWTLAEITLEKAKYDFGTVIVEPEMLCPTLEGKGCNSKP